MIYRSKLVLLPLLLVLAVLGASPAAAQGSQDEVQAIRAMLEQRDDDIKSVLEAGDLDSSKKEKLKELINSAIDFRAMGSSALGRHWEPLTPEQQDKFVAVFGDIVRSQSVSDLDVYRSPVEYGDIAVDGTSATASTTIRYKDEPTAVDYLLVLQDAKWWVKDIVLKDVSTVDGYSRSFQSVVRKKGFETLMTKLEAKLAKTESAAG